MSAVGWLGLGKLGSKCADTLASCGHDVYGHDPRPPADPGRVKLATLAEVVAATDGLVLVCVQTPHAPEFGGDRPVPGPARDFDYTALVSAVRDLAAEAKAQDKPVTAVVISTVLPGTTRTRLLPLLRGTPVRLVYGPYFPAMGTEREDFLDPEFQLLGADDGDAVTEAAHLYTTVHRAPVRIVSIESAELAKVAYNTLISCKIVYANWLGELCEATGADADEVTGTLALATRRILSPAYLRAGMGDGGACFPPGETVITEHGPRPIEEIRTGDLVLTFDGTLQPVIKTWERHYNGELVTVQPLGLPAARMTADHPVMARCDLRARMGNGKKPTTSFPRSDVGETPAGDLTADHLVRWPVPAQRAYEVPEHVTPEYLELAGWYLAEGSVELSERRGRLRWDLHIREAAEAERIAELAAICAPPRTSGRGANATVTIEIKPEQTRRSVRFGSIGLARLVGDFGKGAGAKQLPPWALWGDEKTAALLLEGMLKGDGHIHPKGVSYSTISVHLAWGCFVLLARLGCHPNLRVIAERPGHLASYEVRVRNRTEAEGLFAKINVAQEIRPTLQRPPSPDDWHPVRKLSREHYAGPVHNLWVAGTNTFVTAAGAVHNCHPRDLLAMSWLSERAGASADVAGFLAAAREVQSRRLADLIKYQHELTGLPVWLLGRAFKPGIAMTDGSPALLLLHQIEDIEVRSWDPLIDSWEQIFDRPGLFVVATPHQEILDLKFQPGSVVIDPHGLVEPQPGVVLVTPGRRK